VLRTSRALCSVSSFFELNSDLLTGSEKLMLVRNSKVMEERGMISTDSGMDCRTTVTATTWSKLDLGTSTIPEATWNDWLFLFTSGKLKFKFNKRNCHHNTQKFSILYFVRICRLPVPYTFLVQGQFDCQITGIGDFYDLH
jgi:hypothetical protein